MPVSSVSVPVYFEFHNPSDGLGTPFTMVEPFLGETVVGVLDFSTNRYTGKPVQLAQSVSYSASLELELPRDSYNTGLGNFMVTLMTATNPSASAKKDAAAAAAANAAGVYRRPAIMPYKSYTLELIDTFLFLPLYATTLWHQTSTITVPLARNLPASSLLPLTTSHSKISDALSTRVSLDRPVNVLKASLIIDTQWQGLRAWMYHYRLLLFIVGPILIWLVEAAVASFVAYFVVNTFGSSTTEISKPPFPPIQQRLVEKSQESQEMEWQRTKPNLGEMHMLDEDDDDQDNLDEDDISTADNLNDDNHQQSDYPSPVATPAHYDDLDDDDHDILGDGAITPLAASTISSESIMDDLPTAGSAPTTPFDNKIN